MSIYGQHKPTSGSDLYLVLKDGDKAKGRIVSDPAISVYKEGDKPRYSWIMLVREFNGKEVNKPQILTKGVSVYNGIADLVEEWGEPTEFDIVIKRTGSGLNDTEYSVTPVKTSTEPTPEQLEEIEKIDLVKAIKGKWLEEYIKDGQAPDPVVAFVPDEDIGHFSEKDIPQ
jgi:hypothetical protein